jgi:hypothetical protein
MDQAMEEHAPHAPSPLPNFCSPLNPPVNTTSVCHPSQPVAVTTLFVMQILLFLLFIKPLPLAPPLTPHLQIFSSEPHFSHLIVAVADS